MVQRESPSSSDVVDMKNVIALTMCIGLLWSPVYSWDHFKGSLERTGSSTLPAPDTPYLLWEVDLESSLYSSPVVMNELVFQVALEKVVCLDLGTGNVVWTSCIPAYHSTPAVSYDRIIVSTNRGVTALSIDEGNLLWEYVVAGRFSTLPLNDYIVSSPAVSGGKVVVGTRPYSQLHIDPPPNDFDDLYLICLDEFDGKERWYVRTTLGVYSSPCISYGKVFAASREMLCIDMTTGDILWNSEYTHRYNLEFSKNERYNFDDSTPALYHGILIGGSSVMGWSLVEPRFEGFQKIVAMDQYTGDILWEWIEEDALASSPAVYRGKIYFYSFDGMVRCLSFLDGTELWESPISEKKEFDTMGLRLWPSPSVADGKVYIGSIDGTFFCLDADTGEILWEYETGGPIHSAPAFAWGKVLISSTDGHLYCFAIDPEAYKEKAQKYVGEKDFGKAEEVLIKAEEYATTDKDLIEIGALRNLVKLQKKEYEKKRDRLAEAEALLDEADRILWEKSYKEAYNLYVKAEKIFAELDEEFGVSFCESRISYLQGKVPEDTEAIGNSHSLVLIIIILTILFSTIIFLIKRRSTT